MDQAFWQQRWQQNQTGFHLDRVNPCLMRHWADLGLAPDTTILVPLCGKSLDLVWLANQGHYVIGVECSELAVQAFFEEQKLPYQRAQYKGFDVYNSGNISLLKGDYFDLDGELLEDVAAVYDRASLVAMPSELRQKYVQKMQQSLPPDGQIMLVTLDYNQQLMAGPPFAVSEQEVTELYAKQFHISRLYQQDILAEEQRFSQLGLDYLLESVFHLKPV